MGSDSGQIVTFYSYKGGTGRTMALANVAWILAANGQRVLVVDWDLEAPGLPKFYRPFLNDKALRETHGVLNLIMDFAFAAEERRKRAATLTEDHDESWVAERVQLAGHTVPVTWDFGKGFLHLLPAGRQNGDYGGWVSGFDWTLFYENSGAFFIESLRQLMKRSYDYVLIDSRTGLSDVGDICTVLLPDTLVNCFTMSDQSIEGAARVAHRIVDRFEDRDIRILPVPMRLDLSAEMDRLEVGRETAQEQFFGFPPGLHGAELERYWRNVEVPYQAYYSYEEILAVFGGKAGAPGAVLSALERVTGEITGGTVTNLPPMDEPLRLRYREAFVRQKPSRRADVYLSYVRRDRTWADWIEAVLTREGYRVLRQPVGVESGSDAPSSTGDHVRTTTRTVAVLSKSYLRSAECTAVREAATALDPIGNLRIIVPLCVESSEMINPFPRRETVNLDQLNEKDALEALLRVVDVDASNPPVPEAAGDPPPRFPGADPPIWGVPARNRSFTGRVQILESLRDQLSQGDSASHLQVLHGLGGVGKTQIALEYAHRFKAEYDVVWWIPSEERNRVQERLAQLAGLLGVRATDVEAASAEVVAQLSSGRHKRALLVFDNAVAQRLDELTPLIPVGGAAHVLITSRDRDLKTPGSDPVDINVFTRVESVEHLQRQVPGLSDGDADRLGETLGDLPIVIELAAAWLKETARPVDDYLADLGDNPSLVMREVAKGYDQPVSAVWQATIDQLRSRSAAAMRLLELCAFFGPEPIATSLIYSDAFIDSLEEFDSRLAGETMMVDRLVMDLGRFALARVDSHDKSIQIHRLLQELVREGLSADEQAQMKRIVRRILAKMRPARKDIDDPESWDDYRILWPHLYVCEADRTDEHEIRQLMVDRVRWLAIRGQIEAARELGQRMWEIWREQSSPDEMSMLALRCEVANALRQLGFAERSLKIDREVLELQQNAVALGPAHLHTLRTAGSLAADLRSLGRWREALERDQETHELMAKDYGNDHRRTLWAANNLAISLRITGRAFEARDRDQLTYDRRRSLLGPSHVFTLGSATNLGRSMRDCGQFEESARLLRTTLALSTEKLGEYTPITLYAAKGLAVAERRTGRHEQARERTIKALAMFITVFGEDAPDTLSCALNLACDESAAGEKARALRRATSVYERYVTVTDRRHPHALAAANNVAIYRRAVGDLEDAERLAKETYETMTEVLGAEHPFTLSCAINVGNILSELERPEQGLDATAAAWQTLRTNFGELHPDTLACAANRTVMLRQAGRDREADDLRRHTADAMGRVYDTDHHDLAALRAGRRLYRDLEPHRT
jgi:MinD-like ATPase involved in chromosome partitioning or flagellar assembly/tetratricopeptide (TPR) repeat protein